MSGLAAVALALAVLVAGGPGGRPVTSVAGGRRDGSLLRRSAAGARRVAVGGRWRRGVDPGPDLVVVVTDVAARLRAGADPRSAWEGALGRRVGPGGPTVADLARSPAGRAPAATVVAAGRLATELGAALAPVLDTVAGQLAAEAEAASERRAALAGPRATARVLTGLPVLGVLLGIAMGADPLTVLLDGALGSAAFAAGLSLVVVGRFWTGRLARRAAAAGRAP